jgi:hypothetical protein
MSKKLKSLSVASRSSTIPHSPVVDVSDEGYESDTVSVEEYLAHDYLPSNRFPKGRVVSVTAATKSAPKKNQAKSTTIALEETATEGVVIVAPKGQESERQTRSTKRALPEDGERVLERKKRYFDEIIDKHELVIEKR